MTVVVEWEQEELPSPDVPASKYPPHRNVRMEDTRWDAFGAAVGERKRSAWLSDFVDMVIPDGKLWLDAQLIARRRNENLGAVVIAALRRYVARNRHLLDNSEDE